MTSEGRGWSWFAFGLVALLVAAFIFGFHLLAQVDLCGELDGGPDPGEEAFCDRGALQVGLSLIPAAMFLAGGIATARTRRYVPLVVGGVLALGVGVTVPFAFVEPVCEGVVSRPEADRERLAVLQGDAALTGSSEEDVCRRIGRPDEVDGSAWEYRWLPPGASQPAHLIVEFDDGTVTP